MSYKKNHWYTLLTTYKRSETRIMHVMSRGATKISFKKKRITTTSYIKISVKL